MIVLTHAATQRTPHEVARGGVPGEHGVLDPIAARRFIDRVGLDPEPAQPRVAAVEQLAPAGRVGVVGEADRDRWLVAVLDHVRRRRRHVAAHAGHEIEHPSTRA